MKPSAGTVPVLDQPKVPAVPKGVWDRFRAWLYTPVNGSSLAVFRIALGLIMALEAWSLCRPSPSFFGKIPLEVFYTGSDVKVHFAYPGFHWLPVLPAAWIKVCVGVLALGGLSLALGLFCRLACLLVFVSWGYLYAIESTRTYWMSYHYLELLSSFLLVWMPVGRRLSLDAWLACRRRRKETLISSRQKAARLEPNCASSTVPFWPLFLLRGQLVITYFYAGVAKLNADWLLDAQPVRYFLAQARWIDDYGRFLSSGQLAFLKGFLQSSGLAYFLSYAGALFDLTVGFLLLFRRTRILGLVLMLIFHTTNHFIIFNDIEWFPLVGILTALIFLDPDWPERTWHWLKRPRLAKPDWRWFIGGAVMLPLVGSALGWKLPPSPGTNAAPQDQPGPAHGKRPRDKNNSAIRGPKHARFGFSISDLRNVTIGFVLAWLAWQALMPLRQYLIAGDARFTWEGLSFSWRLKAEVYRCTPCQLLIEDHAIISRSPGGQARIDWQQWRGEKVMYRTLTPGHVDWSQLPEIFVLVEPRIGQRILYNPFSGGTKPRSETESRARVTEIWQQVYRHQPQVILKTASATETLSACGATLRAHGYTLKTTLETSEILDKLLPQHDEPELTSILRQTHPLALQGGSDPAVPFLLIEDAAVARNPGSARMRVTPERWVYGPYLHCQRDSLNLNIGGQPLVLYTGATPFELSSFLPETSLFEAQDRPESLPYIWWNYLNDLTYSEGMHLSMQPFILREYARHVADQWEKAYGRRPVIHAETAVSLNFRPAQRLVDPDADLASVNLSRVRHNPWIRDLETARIPR